MKSKKQEKTKKSTESSTKSGNSKIKKVSDNAFKKLRVPNRLHRETFKTLMISKKQNTISADKKTAYEMRTLGGQHKGFLKIDLPSEIMNNQAHKVGMPDRYSTTLFAPPVPENKAQIHYLYNTYNFMDDLTKYDIYRRAAHFFMMIPTKKRVSDRVKLAGTAVCSVFDVKRRREKLRLRGRSRPDYSNYGKRMLESPRMLVAKFLKYGQPYFGQLITSHKEEANKMTKTLVENLKENLRTNTKETKGRILKFLRHNHDWMKDRMLCCRDPMFLKFNRNRLYTNVVKHHQSMPYRKRGDQDLFSEFNFLSPHLAFSVHFCRVIKKFRINMAKEDEVLQKHCKLKTLIRVRTSRYAHFPAISVVNYNSGNQLQLTIPRTPKRPPSIVTVSGYSSDSANSAGTDTPLDWELDWKLTDTVMEHQMTFTGDTSRCSVQRAAEKNFNRRKWREMTRRKQLLFKADSRFELQDTVPIFKQLTTMHPSLIYCKLRGMELNKLVRRQSSEKSDAPSVAQSATSYLFQQRITFLEKTLPSKNDTKIVLTPGWRTFAIREKSEKFPNVSRILRQKTSWVSKNCMSRSATVPRCDKLPMTVEVPHKKLLLVLILLLTLGLVIAAIAMISFL